MARRFSQIILEVFHEMTILCKNCLDIVLPDSSEHLCFKNLLNLMFQKIIGSKNAKCFLLAPIETKILLSWGSRQEIAV